ncbi:MMPL family transporter [Actinoplanes aureus]|uniref:MMPL family transporter n=1 Tax=Actinoplanes aureus TaxID=2792083 RepID=UPI0028149F10|nr:MMPL family transporter [Actinoplanes aureus]
MLIIALVAVIGSGVWGFGVFDRLSEGGYNDPRSESGRAADVVAEALDGQGGDVIAIYTPDQGTIDDAALSKRIKERLAALPESAVTAHDSYWEKKAAGFAAEDKSSAIAVITVAGDDDAEKMDAYAQIEDDFTVPGAHVQLAGGVPLNHTSSVRSTQDLASAELISLPIVLILLLLIFGSLVAAALPVLIGGCAVLGSLGVLHAVALNHEVNSFAVNVASLLGLGMAIDYGLFMVGRFREEQAVHSTAEAVRRTVATAGRTVLFSATLLMTALAGLLLFPQGFLKSLAYGGLAAVFLAMLLSLTLLPAILAIIGPGVDKLPVRLPGRRDTGAGPGGWERLAGAVLRRPFLVALPILAALLVLALPITDARFGENDERVLPAGDPGRVAVETLKTDYPQFSADGVQLVVRGTDGKKPDVKKFTETAGKVPGIAEITTSGTGDDVVVLNADLESTDSFSTEARQAVENLRALSAPANAEVLVGGITARNVDSLDAIADRLPLMIGLLAGATLVLMFLAFGSILLPIKAVVVSALSLCATFGILVWIFQEGHGSGLLNVTPAPLEAGIVVLMAAVVFGLSTDYEVFLLSRMVEARTRGASTAEAVTIGLSRTGRVISAAALLLIVVTGAFALSSVTTMKFVGVGMIIALVLDATVVRMLLVPAVLALFGDAAWWAPGPLRRLQERAGLAEHAGEAEITDWQPPVSPALAPSSFSDDTVTFALPAGVAAAGALPAGTSVSQTVVLDYAAVLDYIAEKEQGAVTRPVAALPAGPGEETTVLPVVAGRGRAVGDSGHDSEVIDGDATAAESEPAAGSATTSDFDAEPEFDAEPGIKSAFAAESGHDSDVTDRGAGADQSEPASDIVDLPVASLLGLEPEKLTEGAAAYPALFADEDPSATDTVTPDDETPIMDAVAEETESSSTPLLYRAPSDAAAPADSVLIDDLLADAAPVEAASVDDPLADVAIGAGPHADAAPDESLPPLLEAVTRAAATDAEPTPATPGTPERTSEESSPIFAAAASAFSAPIATSKESTPAYAEGTTSAGTPETANGQTELSYAEAATPADPASATPEAMISKPEPDQAATGVASTEPEPMSPNTTPAPIGTELFIPFSEVAGPARSATPTDADSTDRESVPEPTPGSEPERVPQPTETAAAAAKAGIDAGPGVVDADASTRVDAAGTDAGAGVDTAGTDAGVDAGTDAGPRVDAGASARGDVGAGPGTGAGLEVSAGAGLSASAGADAPTESEPTPLNAAPIPIGTEPFIPTGSDIAAAASSVAPGARETAAAMSLDTAQSEPAGDIHAGPSEPASDIHTGPSEPAGDIHAGPSELASDIHAGPSEPASDIHAGPSEPASDIDAAPSEPAVAEDETVDAAPASGRAMSTGSGSAPAPAGIEDLFAWRSDPRLMNLAASGSDSFGWLPHAGATGGGSTTPEESVPAAEVAPAAGSESRSGAVDEDQATSAPWQPATLMPEAALPYSFQDRPGNTRPQTLGDWTGNRPAQDRPRSLDDLTTPVSAVPATGRRPQTLDEWLSGPAAEGERPSRPETLGDLSATPVGPAASARAEVTDAAEPAPADRSAGPEAAETVAAPIAPATQTTAPHAAEFVSAERPTAAHTAETASAERPTAPHAAETAPAEQPITPHAAGIAPAAQTTAPHAAETVPAERPTDAELPPGAETTATTSGAAVLEPANSGDDSGFIRRPQTLDEWLKGGPIVSEPAAAAERPHTLGDLTTGGIRRPKTLDDWLSGATPTGPSTPPESAARPATLADDEAVRRRAANGGPHNWAGGSGEHPYDRSGRRPSSLADHPGSASRAGRKPAGEEPEPDPAPQP